MTIVSSEPIVLIGPGSEWFWSAAQLLVVAITLVGIYYQLRLQRAANSFEQIHQLADVWNSERLVRARLRVAQGLAGGDEMSLRTGVGLIGDYFEEVASLVRAGHIDMSVAYENFNHALRFWWTAMEDTIERERKLYGQGGEVWIHFERLARDFSRLSLRDEHPTVIDKAHVIGRVPDLMETLKATLRLIEELREVPGQPVRTEPPSRRRRSPAASAK